MRNPVPAGFPATGGALFPARMKIFKWLDRLYDKLLDLRPEHSWLLTKAADTPHLVAFTLVLLLLFFFLIFLIRACSIAPQPVRRTHYVTSVELGFGITLSWLSGSPCSCHGSRERRKID